MSLPTPLAVLLREHGQSLLALNLSLTGLLLIGLAAVFIRLARLNRLYARLTRGTSGGNLEEILHEHIGSVDAVARRMQALEGVVTRQGDIQLRCLQKLGIVRFDAFEDVGGEQSFALVLLDAERNGIAVSSVYSRADVRIYAKGIRNGAPSHPLTHEEQQALALAEGR